MGPRPFRRTEIRAFGYSFLSQNLRLGGPDTRRGPRSSCALLRVMADSNRQGRFRTVRFQSTSSSCHFRMEITTGTRSWPIKKHTKQAPYISKKAPPWYCAWFLKILPGAHVGHRARALATARRALSHIKNLTHRRRRSNRPHHRHCRRCSHRRSHLAALIALAQIFELEIFL